MNEYYRKNLVPAIMLVVSLLLMRSAVMKKLDAWQVKRQAKLRNE